MKQGQFETLYASEWQRLEQILTELETKSLKEGRFNRYKTTSKLSADDFSDYSRLYRKICHYHSLANERKYSSILVDHLGDMVVRGYSQLYQQNIPYREHFLRFFVSEFPSLLRQEARYFWVASAVLYLPALLIFLAVIAAPEMVYTVLPPADVLNFEEMYNPANRTLGSARDSGTNWMMFGHYINNNIGVSFRTFASGIVYCLGSLFFLFYNGLLLGAVSGHLTNTGFTETFFSFVAGHGSFELTAIAISGAAGMKLGMALIAPGNLSRIDALKRNAVIAIKLMYGVIAMLLIAAFIEAFWSSNNYFQFWQKYLVASLLWFIVTAYFLWSGRQYGSK